jgi:tetratricopeptide (TPR) repeat protein
MRQIRLILLLLGILMAVGMIGAQEEEMRIFYNLRESISEDDFSVIEDLFEATQNRLLDFNVRVVFEAYNPAEVSYQTVLVDFSNPQGEITAWISTNNLEIEKLSPILYSSFSISDSISENLENNLVALSLYHLNRLDDAESIFYSHLPNNIEEPKQEYFFLGNIQISEADYETAIEYFHNIESRGQYLSVMAGVNEAWVYWQFNDILIYANTQKLPIVEAEIFTKRAWFHALAFDYDSAIADMDEAITLAEENEADNTTLAELYTIRGQIIFLLYEWDRVLENFNHAIELDPNYAPAYFERGVLYYTMTQRENALADFQHYLELEPDGLHAEEAAQYIESIEIELESLGG